MDFKTRKENFYNRFGLKNFTDHEKDICEFKMGIINSIDKIDSLLSKDEIIQYCTNFGVRAEFLYLEERRMEIGENVYRIVSSENDLSQLLFKIETLLNLDFENTGILYGKHEQFTSQDLFKKIHYVFQCSNLDINITQSQDGYIIYPAGEKFLDQELVEKTLKFLGQTSNSHYVSAIKHYSNKNEEEFIKAAESIRRCLEEFLREKLGNNKGLNANLSELENSLKEGKGIKEIRNIVHSIFDTLDKLFNKHSKHHDGDIGEEECEFLIYQSGLLMRYINKKISIKG